MLDAVRKAFKKIAPDTKGTNEEICKIISDEIIKRDVLDDERAVAAKKLVTKALAAPKKTETAASIE